MAEQYETEDLLAVSDEETDPAMDAEPGADVPVAPFDGLTVVQAIQACWDESDEAYANREQINKVNLDAAHCRQVFEGKVKGQSAEFVPKLPMAVEQFAAFVKRGLVGFGNYFTVDLTPSPSLVGGPLTEGGIVKLMRHRLESPDELPPGAIDFPTSVSDGVKVGSLEASMVFKVCGTQVVQRRWVTQPVMSEVPVTDGATGQPLGVQSLQTGEELVMQEGFAWRVLVELVRPADYRPDPTGRGLYEVHRTRKDLYQVIEEAEAGYYDPEAVAELVGSYDTPEQDYELAEETDQPTPTRPTFRKEVELLEFWGTLLDSDGHVAHRNCRAVVANGRYLVCKPEPNPYWHQESPFVKIDLLRVPFATFHKALFDHAVRINLAMNELYNLIVDGGIGSVWGNRQVWLDLVDNAEDFSDGIPLGATMVAKPEAPQNMPLMLNTPSGVVPPEAMGVYQLMDREFSGATMLSSTAMGQVPRKDVSATATASADQSSGMFFDDVIATIEAGIRKVLRLVWLTMLQNVDDWNGDDTVGCIGPQAAEALAQMSPAQRYATYAQGARFRVNGLSSMLARTREFQKLVSVQGVVAQSPVLGQAFMQRYSPDKMLHQLFKSVNLDPEDLRITEEEQAALQERIQQLPMFGQGGGMRGEQQLQMDPTQAPGSPTQQTQAAIAQMQQPPQGF